MLVGAFLGTMLGGGIVHLMRRHRGRLDLVLVSEKGSSFKTMVANDTVNISRGANKICMMELDRTGRLTIIFQPQGNGLEVEVQMSKRVVEA